MGSKRLSLSIVCKYEDIMPRNTFAHVPSCITYSRVSFICIRSTQHIQFSIHSFCFSTQTEITLIQFTNVGGGQRGKTFYSVVKRPPGNQEVGGSNPTIAM